MAEERNVRAVTTIADIARADWIILRRLRKWAKGDPTYANYKDYIEAVNDFVQRYDMSTIEDAIYALEQEEK